MFISIIESNLFDNESSCSCSNFISDSGYGRCQKSYLNGPLCYVKLPTTCKDVVTKDSHGPTGYSWQACKKKIKRTGIKGNRFWTYSDIKYFLPY